MNDGVTAQQVAGVANRLAQRADELALGLARAIRRDVATYQAPAAVPFKVLAESCAANVQALLAGLANGSAFDTTAATRVGVERAGHGVPLSSVMEAYRIGFRHIWDVVVCETTAQVGANGDATAMLTAKMLAAQELFTTAMAVGYRSEQSRQRLGDEARRSTLIDALLHGRLLEQW
ncbi:MAG: hypothetical protein JO045_11115, partial [Mycobacterium sp.]|nr:hypothetical protein [Mycobacterium sp.]